MLNLENQKIIHPVDGNVPGNGKLIKKKKEIKRLLIHFDNFHWEKLNMEV